MRELKPQCSWDCGVDVDGLGQEDQKRIQKIGLLAWMDEISTGNSKEVMLNETADKRSRLRPQSDAQGAAHPSTTQASMTKESPPSIKSTKSTKAHQIGQKFLEVARKSKDVVTYEQAALIHPSYPSDTAYYAKQLGASVITDRKHKVFKVVKYV